MSEKKQDFLNKPRSNRDIAEPRWPAVLALLAVGGLLFALE
jgi:hypothetical protein